MMQNKGFAHYNKKTQNKQGKACQIYEDTMQKTASSTQLTGGFLLDLERLTAFFQIRPSRFEINHHRP